jgi:hypothetical protein
LWYVTVSYVLGKLRSDFRGSVTQQVPELFNSEAVLKEVGKILQNFLEELINTEL